MLTSDPIYNKPYKPQITIKNTGNSTTYYDFNPWTDSGDQTKPTHLSLNLSENTHGKFVCQIEDGDGILDRFNINKGARLIVKVGKQASQMTTIMSGLIREVADARGSNRKDLYTLGGSSTSIRNNERVIYFVRQARKLASDGLTIDTTDPNMKAVQLLVQAYAGANSICPSYGSEGGLGILDITNTAANSTVNNFIADMAVEFGEIQDAINLVEDQSNSETIINTSDQVNLRYDLRNLQGGRGFIIKNQTYRISGQDDDADDTMYLVRKNWKYSDSVYKADSYANRLSAILPADTLPSDPLDLGGYNPTANYFYSTGANSAARKFRPTHSRCFSDDFFLGLSEVFGSTSIGKKPFNALFVIVDDAGTGTPASKTPLVGISYKADNFAASDTINDGALVVNKGQFFNPANGALLSTQEINLDTNKDYWFIMTSGNSQSTVGATDEKNVLWWTDTTTTVTNGAATAAKAVMNPGGPFTSTGSPWTVLSSSNPPLFKMPRTRSMSIIMHDPKAIKNLGSGLATGGTPIEAHLPSFPSLIKTKAAGYTYVSNQLYYMAKPRANYSMPAVTAPNVPPMPGDPIIISDSVLDFSTPGHKVIFTRCGDYSLSWGNLDGSGLTYTAPTLLNINPVGNIPRYK